MTSNINTIVSIWSKYLESVDWKDLIADVKPSPTGCGPVYEIANPIERPNESFAIADMRNLETTEPHYHPVETEIYFVLQGTGIISIGGEVRSLKVGDVVVTPPGIAHFTIPENNLVLAVVNTPPFKPENYVPLTETNKEASFDMSQYETLNGS